MKRKYLQRSLLCGMVIAAMGLVMMAVPARSFAMDPVETEKSCTLTVSAENSLAEFPDLTSAEMTVKAYRVAEISKFAEYTATAGFEELDFKPVDPAAGETTTAAWESTAEAAAKILGIPYGEDPGDAEKLAAYEKTAEESGNPVPKTTVTDGTGTISGLKTGLYLVYVEEAKTLSHEYTFTPYLVSLPNNEYYIGGAGQAGGVPDRWDYEVTVGLKPQQKPRYAELTITKNLNTYNASLGDASFIFQIDAYRDGELIYSNPVSLNFTDPGTSSVTIQIPAGTEVHIQEIYSNKAYKLESIEGSKGERNGDTWVLSLEPDDGDMNGDIKENVTFTNDTTGNGGRGTSIVNHFETAGEGWKWIDPDEPQNQE